MQCLRSACCVYNSEWHLVRNINGIAQTTEEIK